MRLGIETANEAQIFMHSDCHVGRVEGSAARTCVAISHGARSIAATLTPVSSSLVNPTGLLEWAWRQLGHVEGATVRPGELDYAMTCVRSNPDVIGLAHT